MKIQLFNQKVSFDIIWRLKKSIFSVITSPTKIINLIKVHTSIFLGNPKLWGVPYSLLLEPTSICNLRCPMCARTIHPQIMAMRPNQNMTFDQFKKIMDEIGNKLFFIFLWNFGEPLINKDLYRMIKYAKKKKIFVLVSTNAYLLDAEKSIELINSGLDYLIISFDGASKESYEKYRKNSDFRKVTENIKNFMILRNKMKSQTPLVNLQFILMKHNVEEVEIIRKLTKDLRVDRLTFKKTILYDDKLEKELLPSDIKFKFNLYNTSKKRKTVCVRPWNNFVINCEGALLPCCDDIFYNNYIGNVFKSGVIPLINNKKYVDFRKKFIDNPDDIKMCKKCPRRFSKDLTLLE